MAEPEEQFLDRLTRLDDLMLANTRAIDNLTDVLKSQQGTVVFKTSGLTNELKKKLESKQTSPYTVESYTLDTARVDEEVVIDGDVILAATDGDLAGCSIKLNNNTNATIPLDYYNPLKLHFFKIFLTTSAQSGKTLQLFIGREASAEAVSSTTVITSRQSFYVIETDKDTHFSGSLAQYAKEDENLTGLLSNNIRVTGIGILSDQQLKYKALFWYSDSFEDTDLDQDEFCGEVELDIPAYGFQVGGTGIYYLDVRNLHVDYQDSDNTKELHISLMNMSTTSKNAGATGEVKLFITYELRA
jgi:hypothetical protein